MLIHETVSSSVNQPHAQCAKLVTVCRCTVACAQSPPQSPHADHKQTSRGQDRRPSCRPSCPGQTHYIGIYATGQGEVTAPANQHHALSLMLPPVTVCAYLVTCVSQREHPITCSGQCISHLATQQQQHNSIGALKISLIIIKVIRGYHIMSQCLPHANRLCTLTDCWQPLPCRTHSCTCCFAS